MPTTPRALAAGALVLALALAACGGDDDAADETTTTTTATSTTGEASTTSEAGTSSTEGDEETVDLASLLVTPEDVGSSFAEQEYETSTEPGPCGGSIDEDHPYEEIVGSVVVDEEAGRALQHELRAYADEDAAAQVFAASQEELSCGADTTVEGLVLEEVTDVSADVGADAYVVPFENSAEGTEGGLVAVQVGAVVSVYQFQGSATDSEGPDPLAIVTANVEELQAALG